MQAQRSASSFNRPTALADTGASSPSSPRRAQAEVAFRETMQIQLSTFWRAQKLGLIYW